MKVLDVGTGAGDVALLAAGLAGREGTVIGIDFNAELIATARARAAAAGLENVSFVVGDAASVELDRGFDAVVGRCVLFFAREPAALVRRLTGYVRDGGIVAFQEPANATLAPMSLPRSQLLERLWGGSWRPTAARNGLVYGLAAAQHICRGRAPGARDAPRRRRRRWSGLAGIRVHGAADSHDPAPDHKARGRDRARRQIDTLADRLRAEIGDDGAAVTWGFITAWARHQARP